MQMNIRDFKMFDKLALHFIAKYVGPYEILHKPHPDMYTLNFPTNFVAYLISTFQKLNYFFVMNKNQIKSKKCDWKLMQLNINLPSKSKAYFVLGKHALQARSTW